MCWACMAVVIAWSVGSTFATIFQCIPVAAFWDKSIKDPKCTDTDAFWVAYAVINIITDFISMSQPPPLIPEVTIRQSLLTQLSSSPPTHLGNPKAPAPTRPENKFNGHLRPRRFRLRNKHYPHQCRRRIRHQQKGLYMDVHPPLNMDPRRSQRRNNMRLPAHDARPPRDMYAMPRAEEEHQRAPLALHLSA